MRCASRSRGQRTRSGARPPDRPNPVEVLEAQGTSRVRELLPVRYSRMAQSPFAFYRGAAAIMAMDLSSAPVTGLRVQACGDAHVANFGKFATPERNMVFDINDFDETLPGPWEWDVKRLAAQSACRRATARVLDASCDRVVTTTVRATASESPNPRRCHLSRSGTRATDIKDVIAHFPTRFRPQVRTRREESTTERSPARPRQADPQRRRPRAIRRGPPAHRPHRQHRPRYGRRCSGHRELSQDAFPRRVEPLRPLPDRRRGPQGRRGGQRRHALLDLPVRRPGPPERRLDDPPGEGGAGVGARALRGCFATRPRRTCASLPASV